LIEEREPYQSAETAGEPWQESADLLRNYNGGSLTTLLETNKAVKTMDRSFRFEQVIMPDGSWVS